MIFLKINFHLSCVLIYSINDNLSYSAQHSILFGGRGEFSLFAGISGKLCLPANCVAKIEQMS